MTPLEPGWDDGARFPTYEDRQSRYGVAYLRAVCAQFGVGVDEVSADEDFNAMDATIALGPVDTRVQVKCTTRRFTTHGQHITLPIKERWAEKWRENIVPAYLLLVQVGHDPGEWIDYDVHYETNHYTSAYWVRVDQLPLPTPPSIQIPFANRFTPETIRDWNAELYRGFG